MKYLNLRDELFWDIHPDKLDEEENKRLIIERALSFGNLMELKGIINGVFVDLLKHDYKFVKNPVETDNIRLLSKADIAAMKINAITGNGTRVKDFIDIYFLLKEYTFSEIINFYSIKYNNRNPFHAIKSLTYFNDIVAENWPNLLMEKELTIEKVKDLIINHRNIYLQEKLSDS
ncbi:MAG: hypothetical protein H8D45_09805 [Bacteroidetes bacterium]|nr:hypothetical protein [Bacteroidota bacterium]